MLDIYIPLVVYKVVEGLIPAIKPEDYLTKSRQRRTIKPKRFDDYVNTNIVENSVKNNTKSFDIAPYSMVDLTKEMYAVFLQSLGQYLRFLL
jgi:hypothetical protein